MEAEIGTPPQTRRSPTSARFSSFQSPKVFDRMKEKEELSNLNDRLVIYIDRMRRLEEDNSKLTAEVTTHKECTTREVTSVKTLYDRELANARLMIDDTNKERSKLQLENNKLQELVKDLNKRLDEECGGRQRAESLSERLQLKLTEKETLYAALLLEKKNLQIRISSLEAQLKQALDDLQHSKAECENELLRRVDAENKIQTLQEEAAFHAEIHKKEVDELFLSQSNRESVTEVDYAEEYESTLRLKLHEIREEFAEEAELARHELDESYRNKLAGLQEQADKDRSYIHRLTLKQTEGRTELDNLRCDYSVLEAKNTGLMKRITELENLRAIDREEARKQIDDLQAQLSKSLADIDQIHEEYEQLMGIKVGLDLEIKAYRTILEGEETRMGNTPSPSRKRARTEISTALEERKQSVSYMATGPVQFVKLEADAKCIQLYNSSTEDQALGGWKIVRVTDGREPVAYQFTDKYVLKADSSVSVWGESSGVKQKLPSDIVLKSEDWGTGISNTTCVQNAEGTEMATCKEMPVVSEVSTSIKKTSTRRVRRTVGGSGQDRESCVIS